jgi:hypothetical protein
MFGAEEALGIHIVIEFKPLGKRGEGFATLRGVVVENDQQFLIGKLRAQDFRIDAVGKFALVDIAEYIVEDAEIMA